MSCCINNKKYNISGIMGGTFDPPHFGHLISAEVAAEQLNLSKVLFIPNGSSIDYKIRKNAASAMQRLEMTTLAVSGNPMFDVSDIEVVSDKTTYTFDTLEKLKQIYQNTKFYFIVGADSLDYMERWKNPNRIFELASIAVVGRKEFSSTQLNEKANFLKKAFGADITFVEMPNMELSSTNIKERIQCGQSVRYMLPDSVIEYINKNRLYLANTGEKIND